MDWEQLFDNMSVSNDRNRNREKATTESIGVPNIFIFSFIVIYVVLRFSKWSWIYRGLNIKR